VPLRKGKKKKLLFRGILYEGFERDAKMPRKRVSLSIVALLGNKMGVCLPRHSEKKRITIPGFLS
jgi:hypothetical protein